MLKNALRHGDIDHLPDLSTPYKASGKIEHRPWFSPEEYKQLYTATREYAKKPPQEQIRWNAEQVHDFVLFMGNTGLRPDEAKNLQHRDVTIVDDDSEGYKILEIVVHGKRGVGYCKSLPGAVPVYKRLLSRPKPQLLQTKRARRRRGEKGEPVVTESIYPQPTDFVFPGNHIKLFNNLLDRTKLKFDREGKPRTAYSLRHTYICMRLMNKAEVYQVAKNCRTSVEMIEKHYAAHIKDIIDTSQINVMNPKKRKNKDKKTDNSDSL